VPALEFPGDDAVEVHHPHRDHRNCGGQRETREQQALEKESAAPSRRP